ncbi:MAG: fumarylacetoacetase, partial [bacterium]
MSDNSKLVSFINTDPDSHFPIQNLPYGIFRTEKNTGSRACVAISDMVLDLAVLEDRKLFENIFSNENEKHIFSGPSLNKFMSLGKEVWHEVRVKLQSLLSGSDPLLKEDEDLRKECLLPFKNVEMCMPVAIGDYTDFYSSKEHATNVGIMFRGKE